MQPANYELTSFSGSFTNEVKAAASSLVHSVPSLADLPDYAYLGFGATDFIALVVELLHKTFPRNLVVSNSMWNIGDGIISIGVGIGQLCEAIQGKVHRQGMTGAKGGVNVTSGVQLITLTGVSPLVLSPIGFAVSASTACALSIESWLHARKRRDDFNFWLEDSLSAWVQMEKNIEEKRSELTMLEKRVSQVTETQAPWLHQLHKIKKEHLAGMCLDSFLLKKDITCSVANKVSKNEEAQAIQAIIKKTSDKLDAQPDGSEEEDCLIEKPGAYSLKNVRKVLTDLNTLATPTAAPDNNGTSSPRASIYAEPLVQKLPLDIQSQTKAIIGNIESLELRTSSKFSSRINEAEKFHAQNDIDFSQEYEAIQVKNQEQAKDALSDSLICISSDLI